MSRPVGSRSQYVIRKEIWQHLHNYLSHVPQHMLATKPISSMSWTEDQAFSAAIVEVLRQLHNKSAPINYDPPKSIKQHNRSEVLNIVKSVDEAPCTWCGKPSTGTRDAWEDNGSMYREPTCGNLLHNPPNINVHTKPY